MIPVFPVRRMQRGMVRERGFEPFSTPGESGSIIGEQGHAGPVRNDEKPPEQSNRSQTADPELSRLAGLWPNLPQGARKAILDLAASLAQNPSPEAGNPRINHYLEST